MAAIDTFDPWAETACDERRAADAASDVWEPLLRKLVDALGRLDGIENGGTLAAKHWDHRFIRQAYQEAKEALDGRR